MTTGAALLNQWQKIGVLLLLAFSWFVLISIGAVALLGFVLTAILAPMAFNDSFRHPHPVGMAFFGLCLAYVAYFAGAGLLHSPMVGYSEALWRIAPIAVIGLVVFFLTTNRPQAPIFTNSFATLVWIGTAISTIVLIILAAMDTGQRAATFHGNPLLVSNALFIGCLLPMVLWHRVNAFGKIALSFLLVAGLIALVLWVEARSHSMFILALGGGIWITLSLEGIRGQRRWIWRVALAASMLLSVAALVFWVIVIWEGPIAQRVQGGLDTVVSVLRGNQAEMTDSSFYQRAQMWQAGWHAFQGQPLWGYGIQNRFTAADLSFSYTHLHNSLITHLVAGGITGALLYLSIVLFAPITWLYISLTRPAYWPRIDKHRRRELFWLGLIVTLCPILSGLTNVVMFESTLVALAILPIGFWVMRLPTLTKRAATPLSVSQTE